MPLGLAYISAAIKDAGYQVVVIDAVGAAPKVRTGYYKGYLVGMRLEDIVRAIPENSSLIGIYRGVFARVAGGCPPCSPHQKTVSGHGHRPRR